jgi:hypothetical protein
MAGRFTFHNKYHRSNHHTVSGLETVDSGLDPIASAAYPFRGIFYNLLTDGERSYSIFTDSGLWHSAYTTVRDNSATWMLTRTLYTTVSSLSDNWNDGYEAYTQFNRLSDLFISLYTTVCSYSAEWGSPYLMFTNRSQIYTHSKTFSGQDLSPIGTTGAEVSTFNWNLDTQQIAFINLNGSNVHINNPVTESKVQGGLYTLVIQQPLNDPPRVYEVGFDTQYRFNDRDVRSNIIHKALSGITVINFICVNDLMFGDVIYLSGNKID